MHFEDRRPDSSEERILPLINVVFLLLIFFMIAGSLSVTEPFEIEPPDSRSEAVPETQSVRILLAADGRLALDGEVVTPTSLHTRLEQRLAGGETLQLEVKADGRVPGNRLVRLMEQLREAGVERVRLLTLPETS